VVLRTLERTLATGSAAKEHEMKRCREENTCSKSFEKDKKLLLKMKWRKRQKMKKCLGQLLV